MVISIVAWEECEEKRRGSRLKGACGLDDGGPEYGGMLAGPFFNF